MKRDPGFHAFQCVHLDEFVKLWKKFRSSSFDTTDETVNQVVHGLPVEALRDWEREQMKKKQRKQNPVAVAMRKRHGKTTTKMKDRRAPRGGTRNRQKEYREDEY